MNFKIETGKAFGQVLYPFMIRQFLQTKNRREHPQTDKGHLQKNSIINIIINGEPEISLP